MASFDLVVTGGAGFIGSHLVERLVERGRVLVLDDLSTGSRENLAPSLASGKADLEVGDVCDEPWVRRALARASDGATLFHLATRNLRRGLADPGETWRVNAAGTRTLASAWAGRRGRFVHVSTSEVFGSSDAPLDETSPPRPLTAYGESKLAGEQAVAEARDAGSIDAVIVRPFNAYGARAHVEHDQGELIPRFLVRAARGEPLPVFGDGTQTRTFTFVGDTVDGIVRASEHPATTRGVWLLAGDEELSVREVAVHIGEVVGRAVTLKHLAARPGDLRRQCADASLTRSALEWEPRVRFREGLARTWDALRARAGAAAVLDVNWAG